MRRTPPTVGTVHPDDAPPGAARPLLCPGYEDLGVLGEGGTSVVHRVHELAMGRLVAMKVLRPERASRPQARARFSREIDLLSRLSHPGIVPVYARGTLDDGRPWYTMPELVGRTLADQVLEAPLPVEAAVDVLFRVAGALAHAHRLGVLHLDVKPSNVFVGDFDAVMLLDWGLGSDSGTSATRAGTPGFMAPEQGRGETVGPTADVYALGATLQAVLDGTVPDELEELIARCLAAAPAARPADAGAVASALRRWRDSVGQRERARALAAEAETLDRAADRAIEEAIARGQQLQSARGRALAAGTEEAHEPVWAAHEAMDQAVSAAADAEGEVEERIDEALALDPTLPDALVLRIARLQRAHRRAVDEGRAVLAGSLQPPLRDAAARLPRAHPARRRAEDYLAGRAWLSLVTDPPGVEVVAHREVEVDRRLVPGEPVPLGRTPLQRIELQAGSWRLVLRHPGHAQVVYPVFLEPLGHWDGLPPDAKTPRPVPLPPLEVLGPEECYVPPGWTRSDEWRWVEGLIVRRFPIRHRERIDLLNALVRAGRREEAEALQPRDPRDGRPELARLADGGFALPDAPGWEPEVPAILLSPRQAEAYARHEAERTGLPWRLPHDDEWEKAGYGVDGRACPWGRFPEPQWSANAATIARPAEVDTFPLDVSVYGVRGVAGNVRDIARADGGWSAHGGSWGQAAAYVRDAFPVPDEAITWDLTARLVRSWPEEP